MGKGFKEAWKTSAEKWSKESGLKKEEADTVLMLRNLGSTDIEGEKCLLSEVSERLSEQTENAGRELSSEGKMLFSCAVLGGLALVILII